MGLKNYGVIKGQVLNYRDTKEKNHFQIVIQTGTSTNNCYRVAVNVRSSENESPDLFYFLDTDFKHNFTEKFKQFNAGYTQLEHRPDSGSLDFIRANMFDISKMQIIPATLPGPNNDLVELVEFWTKKALNEKAEIYAFGERWFPKLEHDTYFSNIPDQGIHDIHMNQGNPNPGKFSKDNGIWQDGGVFFYFSLSDKWTALFLRFQSQAIHTDDTTGHPLKDSSGVVFVSNHPNLPEVNSPVYIEAAFVNPVQADDTGLEKVLLFNPNETEIDLNGWGILDSSKRKEILQGTIKPGETLTVILSGRLAVLGNNGGIITLVDNNGMKIDGVAYTHKQAKKGKWVRF
jgi:uncharacterized protein YukJ